MVLSVDERFELVKRNTAEIVTEDELKELLKKDNISMYLGTAITGRPHIGYYGWVLKLADLVKAGFKVKILLADFHGALDNCPWEVLEKRFNYYEKIIPLMFESLGVDLFQVEFVKGSGYQLSKEYFFDVLKMSTFVSIRDCKKAASEVVKNVEGEGAKLSGFIYPIMQSLDEQYLGVDMQAGATDQRKIFMFARENLPKLGYKSRVELMIPMIPGLIGKKMSASDPKSKVDLLDNPETVKNKLKSAEMIANDPDNGVMAFLRLVIMTLKSDKNEKFVVERDEKFGGNLEYDNYDSIEKDYKAGKIHPLDLKNAVAREISFLLENIHKHRDELEKLAKDAYD